MWSRTEKSRVEGLERVGSYQGELEGRGRGLVGLKRGWRDGGSEVKWLEVIRDRKTGKEGRRGNGGTEGRDSAVCNSSIMVASTTCPGRLSGLNGAGRRQQRELAHRVASRKRRRRRKGSNLKGL